MAQVVTSARRGLLSTLSQSNATSARTIVLAAVVTVRLAMNAKQVLVEE